MQKAGAFFTICGFHSTVAFAWFCGSLLLSVIWRVGQPYNIMQHFTKRKNERGFHGHKQGH
jgi:hypothetical protein